MNYAVDDQTRCIHYHTVLDIVALKYKCCQTFYPCHQCHANITDHPLQKYNVTESPDEKVILCGHCKTEMVFSDYNSASNCKYCGAGFNPGCANHYDLYFEGI